MIETAFLAVSKSMLSSIIISAFTSKASLTISSVSVSTSIFLTKEEFFLAKLTALVIPPAASMWLSFNITPSDRLIL